MPALRGIGRLGRRGPIALRLAAASLARNPGHAAIASTFLVASLGLALFAVSYRSTLLTGQRDEARYAVPASFLLSEDFDQLVPVLHGARLSRYPTTPMQALRLTGNVPSGTTFTFLGLPSGSLAGIDGWRPDFAQRPLPSLASSLTPARPSGLRTTSLPPGRRFSLPVSVTGDDIGVRAIFRSPLGDFQAVGIGHTNGARTVTLRGRIPFDNATLAQLQFDVLNNGRITANAGTGIQPSAKGILSFGRPRVDGRLVPHAFTRWTGTGGVGGAPARLGFVLTTDRVGTFRPVQPTDGIALRVLATPGVVAAAGPRGIIPLEIEGEQIAARIVGTVDRFPSVVGDAVVADRQTAATILDTRSRRARHDRRALADGAGRTAGCDRCGARARAVQRAAGAVAGGDTLAAAGRSARARCALHSRGHGGGRAAAGAARPAVGRRRRRAGRPRRAVRPRGAGRRAVDRARAPATARVARRRVRDSRRARYSARSCRRS